MQVTLWLLQEEGDPKGCISPDALEKALVGGWGCGGLGGGVELGRRGGQRGRRRRRPSLCPQEQAPPEARVRGVQTSALREPCRHVWHAGSKG